MAAVAEEHSGSSRRRSPRPRALAGDHNLIPRPPHVHRGLRDAGLGVPEAARRRPRRSCSSRPSRASASAAGRSSAGARDGCCAGASRDGGDPYALAPSAVVRRPPGAELAGLPPFAGGAVGFFGYDCVRAVERLPEPNPDVLGLPDMALMLSDVLVAFDHLKHTVTILANAYLDDDDGIDAAHARAVDAIRDAPRAPGRAAARGRRARRRRPRAALRVQHAARAVRGDRRADHRVHPRRRRLPGRALAALVGAGDRSSRSRSTAACAPSTRRRTCTSSTSTTSRSSAPRPSRC